MYMSIDVLAVQKIGGMSIVATNFNPPPPLVNRMQAPKNEQKAYQDHPPKVNKQHVKTWPATDQQKLQTPPNEHAFSSGKQRTSSRKAETQQKAAGKQQKPAGNQ